MNMSVDSTSANSNEGVGDSIAKQLYECFNNKLPETSKHSYLLQRLLSGSIFPDQAVKDNGDDPEEATNFVKELEESIEEQDEENDGEEEDTEFARLRFSRSVLIDCLARRDLNLLADRCIEALQKKQYVADACRFLGLLFEEVGDIDRYLTFTILSLTLKIQRGSDPDEWVTLASQSAGQSNYQQAVFCIGHAMKARKNDGQLFFERGGFYQQLGRHKLAIADYCSALEYFGAADRTKLVNTFHNLSKIYYNTGETEMAIECLLSIFNSHSDLVTSEEVNYLLDLYIEVKRYSSALGVVCQFCKVVFKYHGQESLQSFNANSDLPPTTCYIDEALSIDLRVKTIICLIKLGFISAIGENLTQLYELNISDVGDLYLDLIDAFHNAQAHHQCVALFDQLFTSPAYKNNTELTLKYSECLTKEGKVHQAIATYKHILELSPHCDLARFELTSLQQSVGEIDGAMQLLASHQLTLTDLPVKEEIFALLVEKCHLLYQENNFDHFAKEAASLLNIFFTTVPVPLALPFTNFRLHKASAMQMWKDVLCNVLEEDLLSPYNVGVMKTVWEIFHKLCQIYSDKRMYNQLFQVAYSALHCSFFFSIKVLYTKTRLICAIAAIHVRYLRIAADCIKSLVFEYPYSVVGWNVLNYVCRLSNEKTVTNIMHKCVRRFFLAHQSNPCAILEDGHRAINSSVYKHALVSYMYMFQKQPNNPLMALLLAATYINMTHNKFVINKHTLVVQGIAFFNHYLQTRGECQESYYNIGRAMSHWGLNYLALHYYKKALELAPAIANDAKYDLSHEIGFNMSRIYQQSGNIDVATYYFHKYCIV